MFTLAQKEIISIRVVTVNDLVTTPKVSPFGQTRPAS
jgi:hypothetical protein